MLIFGVFIFILFFVWRRCRRSFGKRKIEGLPLLGFLGDKPPPHHFTLLPNFWFFRSKTQERVRGIPFYLFYKRKVEMPEFVNVRPSAQFNYLYSTEE